MVTEWTRWAVVRGRTWTIRAVPEDGQWTATCAELGVASCGDGPAEALSNAIDAVGIYLTTVEEG